MSPLANKGEAKREEHSVFLDLFVKRRREEVKQKGIK